MTRLASLLLSFLLIPLALAGEALPNYAPILPGAVLRVSTAQVISSNWDATGGEWVRIGSIGSGMAASQASGNAVITTGTTANSETIFRVPRSFVGPFTLRGKVTLSQRIANNNFAIEAVDLLGDGLTCTINSTVSITVQLPVGYPALSAQDVGKSFTVGAISGAAGVPGRYPIASVDATGKLATLTVSGWPASGSCTLSAWGLSGYRMLYTSTTATNVAFDAYRNGWGSNDTTLTINTTASGHVFGLTFDGISAGYLDGTTNSVTWTQRGQRTERMPDAATSLVVQVRATNGTTNPASGTTFTLGELVIECPSVNGVMIQGQRGLGAIDGSQAVTITGNTSSNASTNVAQINGVTPLMGNGTTGTGSLRVTLASDFTTNTNPILVGGTGATSIGKARDSAIGATDTGVAVLVVRRDTPTAETPVAGDYIVPQYSANGEQWTRDIGAPTTHHLISAASTNATSVKASAGTVNHIVVNNVNAAVRYLKLYNKASAPTVGTDTPVLTLAIPAGTVQSIELGSRGLRLGTGIAYALTTGITVADTGAVAASEHAVHISYE